MIKLAIRLAALLITLTCGFIFYTLTWLLWIECQIERSIRCVFYAVRDNVAALLTPAWWLSSSPNPYFKDGCFIDKAGTHE